MYCIVVPEINFHHCYIFTGMVRLLLRNAVMPISIHSTNNSLKRVAFSDDSGKTGWSSGQNKHFNLKVVDSKPTTIAQLCHWAVLSRPQPVTENEVFCCFIYMNIVNIKKVEKFGRHSTSTFLLISSCQLSLPTSQKSKW